MSRGIEVAWDDLRACSRRSQRHAVVCEPLPGDRKSARWFAGFSQEIANPSRSEPKSEITDWTVAVGTVQFAILDFGFEISAARLEMRFPFIQATRPISFQ